MAKYDLTFNPPLMNAAGALGYYPDRRASHLLDELGAFVTNPISKAARTPAAGPRCLDFPAGFLLHTGYPNPGFRSVVNRYARQWEHLDVPVIVHLLAQAPDDLAWMVSRLEGMDGLMGVEVGLPPDAEPGLVQELVAAAWSELPVIARLPLECARQLAWIALQAGAAAVSLGPARGALPAPGVGRRSGRLYGPALFPQALETVLALVGSDAPVIGAGGVYHPAQMRAMLDAGVQAVQLDAVLWTGRALSAWRQEA